jgi:signal transduction histidine kinase
MPKVLPLHPTGARGDTLTSPRRAPGRTVAWTNRHHGLVDIGSGLLMFAGLLLVAADTALVGRVALGSIFGVTLAIRNRFPRVAYIGAGLPFVIWSHPSVFSFGNIPLVLTGYALASRTPLRPWLIGLSTTAIASLGLVAQSIGSINEIAGGLLLNALLGFLPIGLAKIQRQSRELAAELELRNTELERLKQVEVQQAVSEERNRIARDLHDVVAHHVSAIALQSNGAAQLVREPLSPDSALPVREALKFIAASSADAMTAMRAMVGALRANEDRAPLSSQPSLFEIDTLLMQARLLGVSVNKTTSGDFARIALTVQLVAYRLIQESLTNVAKHSTATTISVDLSIQGNALKVTVSDDGTVKSLERDPHNRFGLIGMHERVQLLGGDLTFGPLVPFGWQVAATIPLEPRDQ